MRKILLESTKILIVLDTKTGKKTYECKIHNDELVKVPFSKTGGMYCPDCEPKMHEYYQKEKSQRLAKMRAGKNKTNLMSLLNSIADQELKQTK